MACKTCAAGMTTKLLGAGHQGQCICKRGSRSQSGKCIDCRKGMICEEGAPEVLIEEGYYSESDLSVFWCFVTRTVAEAATQGRLALLAEQAYLALSASTGGQHKRMRSSSQS